MATELSTAKAASTTADNNTPAHSGGVGLDTKRMMQYDANKRSVTTAYILWFFLGWLGAHRFYIGNTGTAVAILALSIVGGALSFIGIGLFILIIPAIWLFVDVFLIPGMVRAKNNSLIQMFS